MVAPKVKDGAATEEDAAEVAPNVGRFVEAAAAGAPNSDGCWVAGAEPNMEDVGVGTAADEEVAPNENIDGRAGTEATEAAAETVARGAGATTAGVAAEAAVEPNDRPPSVGGAADLGAKLNDGAGIVVGAADTEAAAKLNVGTAAVDAGGAAVVVVETVGCTAIEKAIEGVGWPVEAGVNVAGTADGADDAEAPKPKLKPVATEAKTAGCVVTADALGAEEDAPKLSEDAPKLNAGTAATGGAASVVAAEETATTDVVEMVAETHLESEEPTEDAKLFNIFNPARTLVLAGADEVSAFVATTAAEEKDNAGAATLDDVELPNENPDDEDAGIVEVKAVNEDVAFESVDDDEVPNKLMETLLLVVEAIGAVVLVTLKSTVAVVAVVVAGPSVSSNKLFTRLMDSSWLSRNAFRETPDSPNSYKVKILKDNLDTNAFEELIIVLFKSQPL